MCGRPTAPHRQLRDGNELEECAPSVDEHSNELEHENEHEEDHEDEAEWLRLQPEHLHHTERLTRLQHVVEEDPQSVDEPEGKRNVVPKHD